jgi:pyrroline-5-carboxylate reductase
MSVRLAVFGGGNMGAALVGGLVASGWGEPEDIVIVEPVPARRDVLVTELAGVPVVPALDRGAEGAVLAVKPVDVAAAAAAAGAGGVVRVLSVAAGVPTTLIEGWLHTDAAVVRAMPNTPALVRAGAAAIAPGERAGEADLAWAAEILSAVGTVVRVPEHLLDAVTGLSGSGPAYVLLVVEALIDAGVLVGLPRDVSRQLTTQLLVGTATLLATGEATPEVLRAQVTSPGGTTAAGLRALEGRAVRAAFLEAVVAATERSKELGEA